MTYNVIKKPTIVKRTIKRNIPGYQSWSGLKDRVGNPNSVTYDYYGGRGITACKAVFGSFDYFIELMGVRPDGKTLDRIDSNLGYWCGKCQECIDNNRVLNMRWATSMEQALNKNYKHVNISGRKGVYITPNNTFRVTCSVNGKTLYLGTFKLLDEAIKVRQKAEQNYQSLTLNTKA